jgi:2-iminobutanoate/2-iminopropanoate deaminase
MGKKKRNEGDTIPMNVISTENAPAAAGPYSQGIIFGHYVKTSGQIPVDPKTGEIPATIEEQTKRALDNVWAVLRAAGVKDNGVISVSISLSDMSMFSKVNLIYMDYFKEPYPARTCIGVSALPKGVMIEVDAMAYIE